MHQTKGNSYLGFPIPQCNDLGFKRVRIVRLSIEVKSFSKGEDQVRGLNVGL